MTKRAKRADSTGGLSSWLEERGSGGKRSCVICENYGEGTPEGEALLQFLGLKPEQRHGTAFATFVRLYLQKRLHAQGDITTWKSHVVRCLNMGGAL